MIELRWLNGHCLAKEPSQLIGEPWREVIVPTRVLQYRVMTKIRRLVSDDLGNGVGYIFDDGWSEWAAVPEATEA